MMAMDAHAVEAVVAALAAAGVSGFAGIYLGAWKTTRHDRVERARARRIDTADELVQAWATALFTIDGAILELARPAAGDLPARIAQAHEDVSTAVKSSVRADLLFGTQSLVAKNTNAVRDETRSSIHAIEQGEAHRARQLHGDASLSQSWLVVAAAAAIQSTGEKGDVARRFETALNEPEIDPSIRDSRRREIRDG